MKRKTNPSGTDIFSKTKRSDIMSRVKSKNTKPEILIRKELHKKGYRFRLHNKNISGSPDLVLPKYKTVVFIHGCFWHQHPGCKKSTHPKQNADFWKNKLDKNIERDARVVNELKDQGWKVIVVWECAIKKDLVNAVDNIDAALRSGLRFEGGNGK